MPGWRNGRRGGLKIRYPNRCVGSTPTPGTNFLPRKTAVFDYSRLLNRLPYPGMGFVQPSRRRAIQMLA